MLSLTVLFASLSLFQLGSAVPTAPAGPSELACQMVQSTGFQPQLLYALPGSEQYKEDLTFATTTVPQNSTCTVEPRNAQELLAIMKLVNQTRTPWAVKGRGHNFNVGFASTPGLQISMAQMKSVTYDRKTQTASYGPGNAWSDIYPQLDQQGVMLVGGRIVGVGSAGLSLGGGFGYKSSQHGLVSDNIVQYELVTYTGQILNVTATSHPDLFFGLQGGLNNFGIVTKFTAKVWPQGLIQGSFVTIAKANLTRYAEAIVKFTNTVKDPKASINPLVAYSAGSEVTGLAYLVYDGPNLPKGIFDDFIALGATFKQYTYSGYVAYSSGVLGAAVPTREQSHTAPMTNYNLEIINYLINTTETLGKEITTTRSGTSLIVAAEYFLPSAYSHGTDAGRVTAYPHTKATPWNPFWVGVYWTDPKDDEYMGRLTVQISDDVQKLGIKNKLSSPDGFLYNNYAFWDTPMEKFFGKNVPRLTQIAKQWDPYNIRALTGGFLFAH